MRWLLGLIAVSAIAQTTSNLTINSGTIDFGSAIHVLPAPKGLAASKPATCTVGEMYFATDATAGQNWYFCTATNVWTQQLNSGGGSPGGSTNDIQFNNAGSFAGGRCTMDSSSNLGCAGNAALGIGSGIPGNTGTSFYTNDGSTGTANNKLVKISAGSTVVTMGTTDTDGAVGICLNNATSTCGTTGNANVVFGGVVGCVFDGATTLGHFVQISATTGGDCHDAGATRPGTGQVIGTVLTTNVGAGTYNVALLLNSPTSTAGNITVGSTTVTGGTTTQCLYDNAGVVGTQACGGGSGVTSVGGLTGVVPGGWILLESNTPSGATESDFTTCMSSSYDLYAVTITNLTVNTNNTPVRLQVSTNGGSTYANTGYYWSQRNVQLGTGTTNANAGSNVAYIGLFEDNTGGGVLSPATPALAMNFFLTAPTSARPFLSSPTNVVFYQTGSPYAFDVSGLWNTATTINAFKVYVPAGTFSANIRCYGIAKQ